MDSIERNFIAENGADRPAMLLTYRDDIIWEDTTLPIDQLRGRGFRQVLAACAAATPGAVRCN